MTAYNREKYIAEAVESVLDSTYTNFELIIVDDASTDQTVEIARIFENKDHRIKVYVNEQNMGDYPNRNLAATYATGKYLKYVDSDDRIEIDGLKTLVEGMEEFPNAGFGICSLKPDTNRSFPFILPSNQAYEYHFFGPGLFHLGPLDVIFTTEAFNAMGGFKRGRMNSDIDMWHRMALEYPVVAMGAGIVWKRTHNEQELTSQHKYIYDLEKIKWIYLKDQNCGFSVSQLQQIKKRILIGYTGFILSGIKRFNWPQVINYSKCFWFVSKIKLKRFGK